MTILFDLDGTLIDSTEAILESFHRALKIHGMACVEDSDITSLIGYPLEHMFQGVGVAESEVDTLVNTYRDYYRTIATQKTVLLPNAKEAVLQAKEFATLGIVTTKTSLYSKEIMRHFGLMEYFDVLIGREDVTYPKPNGEPIEKAILALGSKKEHTWMIGDTKLDIQAAEAAGVFSAGVTSGYDSLETLKKHTDVIFSDALEVVRFLSTKK
ncbi:MAG: HAD-IA family hydrolase [Sulfurimonadaceae bacterium]|nr:HAD-IA family hydrolase [Sulfurimonadaceae bacterium]